MANELRVRQNFLGGLIEDNPLTSSATTLTSAALAAMVAIGSTQHLPIILDPDGLYGEPEIAYITAHAAGATTATILRAQEGTTARAHPQDQRWSHGPTMQDFFSPGPLAILSYTAGAAYSTSSTTSSDVDATNLAIAFTAPASGKVLVRLGGVGATSGSNASMYWQLREGTTVVKDSFATSATGAPFTTVPFLITGLTPFSAHTYKWGFRVNGAVTGSIYAGAADAPAHMEVWPVMV